MDFFDITHPEIAERLIAENQLAFAFPTNIPIVPGHTLIFPKRPVATVDELTHDELLALCALRATLAKALRRAFGAEGFNYAWNEGVVAGQSVQHVHLHMLPRKKDDTGITQYEPLQFLYRPGSREASSVEELIAVARAIKDMVKQL